MKIPRLFHDCENPDITVQGRGLHFVFLNCAAIMSIGVCDHMFRCVCVCVCVSVLILAAILDLVLVFRRKCILVLVTFSHFYP